MEIDANSIPKKLIPKAVTAEAYQAFAQNEYYLERWEPLIKGNKSWGGFNLAAGFFGVAWCFYRKLYTLGIALLTAEIVLMQVAFLSSKNLSVSIAKVMVILSLLLAHLSLGLLANKVYFQRAKKIVTEAANSRLPEEYFEPALKDAGGTSFGAALGFLGIVAVLQAIVGVIRASL